MVACHPNNLAARGQGQFSGAGRTGQGATDAARLFAFFSKNW